MIEWGQGTYNVTGDDLPSQDLLLLTVTLNHGTHSDVTLETGDDVGSLLLLVPTDNSVKEKNTNDDTEINPVTKTSSKTDSQFHN